jgi:hypothetical protein
MEGDSRGRPDNVIDVEGIAEFVSHIGRNLDTVPKTMKAAEQFAVLCSNIRPGQAKYEEFQEIVIGALEAADRSSVIADQEDPSGQIRLTKLEDEISRADTVVVLCFDQEWNWANKIILQLRQMIGEQATKTKIFVTGPEHRNKGEFRPAFKFKTVIGVTPDNRVPTNRVTDEITRLFVPAG